MEMQNEIERNVISAILNNKLDNWEVVLSPDDFTVPVFKRIFEAAKECVLRYNRVDPEAVFLFSSALIPHDVLDDLLSTKIVSNIDVLLQVLVENSKKRKLRETAQKYSTLELPPEEFASKLVSEVEQIMSSASQDVVPLSKAIFSWRERWGNEREIQTGIYELDNRLKIRQGYFVTVGARPNVGKTGFALNLGFACASRGVPVLFFSLEMSAIELVSRLISRECGIDVSAKEVLSQYEIELVEEAVGKIESLPFFINDSSFLDIYSIQNILKTFARKHDFGVIIVDYLQLISHVGVPGDTNAQRISFITKMMKGVSKSLNLPIIILSQLRRGGGDEPELEYLKESGAIEEDSDIVILLSRDVGSDVIDIHVKKNRYGQAGYKVQATFQYGSKIV